jgi:hypothetical protein
MIFHALGVGVGIGVGGEEVMRRCKGMHEKVILSRRGESSWLFCMKLAFAFFHEISL